MKRTKGTRASRWEVSIVVIVGGPAHLVDVRIEGRVELHSP